MGGRAQGWPRSCAGGPGAPKPPAWGRGPRAMVTRVTLMSTHTQIHLCTHTRVGHGHAHTRVHLHTCLYTLTHTHMHTCVHRDTHTCTYTVHSLAHVHTHVDARTRTHTCEHSGCRLSLLICVMGCVSEKVPSDQRVSSLAGPARRDPLSCFLLLRRPSAAPRASHSGRHPSHKGRFSWHFSCSKCFLGAK